MSDKSQFEQGYQIPTGSQPAPGKQSDLPVQPAAQHLPTSDGGYALYKAAGKLQGKKALITGGDSGIGQATAILFAMEGADSFITYLPAEKKDAEQTKSYVESCGRKCDLYEADLKDKAVCRQMVDEAYKVLGEVNVLFNNHAYQMMCKDIRDLSEDQWEQTFATNIHPFFYISKYCLEKMKKGDTIINNASINAYIGRPDLLDYTSTKGAITSFTRGLSNQFIGRGIRVNQIAPGPVWTPLVHATMDKDAQEQFTSPMGRPSQPSEIATCVVFLASTDSSSISGQTIHCNGGVVVNG